MPFAVVRSTAFELNLTEFTAISITVPFAITMLQFFYLVQHFWLENSPI